MEAKGDILKIAANYPCWLRVPVVFFGFSLTILRRNLTLVIYLFEYNEKKSARSNSEMFVRDVSV